ncbi:MAG TPA: hypothetical protein VIK39_08310 [Candidatus Angelobacter sp.]
MKKYIMIFALAMFALSTASFAGTTATGTNTVAPTLQISATIQSAVQLTLSTGTVATAHCAVTAGGTTDYAMNFGTVDALGINAGACNKFAPTTPGTTNAIYWSDYTVTPIYTSQSVLGTGTTIKAQVTTDFPGAAHNILIVRDSANSPAVPAAAGSFTAMGTASADTIVTGAASGTAQTRYIGVAVTPASGPTVLTGPQTATVTFTLTVL